MCTSHRLHSHPASCLIIEVAGTVSIGGRPQVSLGGWFLFFRLRPCGANADLKMSAKRQQSLFGRGGVVNQSRSIPKVFIKTKNITNFVSKKFKSF